MQALQMLFSTVCPIQGSLREQKHIFTAKVRKDKHQSEDQHKDVKVLIQPESSQEIPNTLYYSYRVQTNHLKDGQL